MKHLFVLFSICLISIIQGIAQIPGDTIFFKNGKKVVGTILEHIPKKTVKIKTTNLGLKVYNFIDIKRISTNSNGESIKEIVYLKSGEVVQGIILEKVYNKSIKIKSQRLGELLFLDSEFDSINEVIKPEDIEKSICFKDGEIIKGYVIEEIQGKSIKLKIKNKGVYSFDFADIEKISESKKNEVIPESDIYLITGVVVRGYVADSIGNQIGIKTKKYGKLLFNLSEIQKIQEVKKVAPVVISEQKDTLKTKFIKKTFFRIPGKLLVNLKKDIKIYDTHAIIVTGAMFSDNIYYLTQVGGGVTLLKQNKISIASELRIGLATNFNLTNSVVSISPLLLNCDIFKKAKFELGPDVYYRLYEGGSIMRFGIVAGANYAFSNKLSFSLRSSIHNFLFIGVLAKYSF